MAVKIGTRMLYKATNRSISDVSNFYYGLQGYTKCPFFYTAYVVSCVMGRGKTPKRYELILSSRNKISMPVNIRKISGKERKKTVQ
jgi:hypothetical protein